MKPAKVLSIFVLYYLLLGISSAQTTQGKACSDNSDCDKGVCVSILFSKECSSGKLNQACNTHDFCNTGRCSAGRCMKKLSDTELCDEDEDCASGKCAGSYLKVQCSSGKVNHTCDSDENCDSGRCSEKICKIKLADGKLCSRDEDCISDDCLGEWPLKKCSSGKINHTCDSDENCDSRRCAEKLCKIKLADGKLCSRDEDCVSDNCLGEWLFEKCSSGKVNHTCDSDDDCDSDRCAEKICQNKLPDGKLCRRDEDCISDDCLGEWPLKKCSSGKVNHTCDSDENCDSGRCSGNICKLQLADGKRCIRDEDCISEKCLGKWDAKECSSARVGQTCESNNDCDSKRCHDERCADKLRDGLSCTVDNDCISDDCLGEQGLKQCSSGLVNQACDLDRDCDSVRCHIHRCKNKLEDGNVCTRDPDCINECLGASGLQECSSGKNGQTCDSPYDCTSRRCDGRRCKEKLGVGKSCRIDGDCINDQCRGRSGFQQCSGGLVNHTCESDFHCDSRYCDNNQCKEKLDDNEPCRINAHCKSVKCRGKSGLMKCSSGHVGQTCNRDDDCTSLRCYNNRCANKVEDGEACKRNHDCINGDCQGKSVLECSSGLVNQTCTSDETCKSNRCVFNRCQEKLVDGEVCRKSSHCVSDKCRGANLAKECSSGLMNHTCSRNHHCVNLRCGGFLCQKKYNLNEVCKYNGDCKSGRCERGKCVQMVKSGKRCLENADCKGVNCLGEEGFKECSAGKMDQACDEHWDCENGRCAGYRCEEKLEDGLPCFYSIECQGGKCPGGYVGECSSGKLNQTCSYDAQCDSKRCDQDTKRCIKREEIGAECLTNRDCESERCVEYSCHEMNENVTRCNSDSDCLAGENCLGPRGYRECSRGRVNEACNNQAYWYKCISRRCVDYRCIERENEGQPCTRHGDCRDDLRCRGRSDSKLCTAGKLNQTCQYNEDCTSNRCDDYRCQTQLTTNGRCNEDSDCASFRCVEGLCGEKAKAGIKCTMSEQCANSTCVGSYYWGPRECSNGKTNQTCTKNEFCDSGWCNDNRCKELLVDLAKCDKSFHCKNGSCIGAWNVPYECSSGNVNHTCRADDTCTTERCDEGRCKPKLKDLMSCSRDEDCASGSCIGSWYSQECSSGEVNHTCSIQSFCKSGWCKNGRCKAKLKDRTSCSSSSDCESGHCIGSWSEYECTSGQINQTCSTNSFCSSDRCEGGRCVPKLKDGTRCNDGKECESGTCLGSWRAYECTSGQVGHTCGRNDFCTSERCEDGRCAAKLKDFTSCSEPRECESGHCIGGLLSPECTSGLANHTCLLDDFCDGKKCVANRCKGGRIHMPTQSPSKATLAPSRMVVTGNPSRSPSSSPIITRATPSAQGSGETASAATGLSSGEIAAIVVVPLLVVLGNVGGILYYKYKKPSAGGAKGSNLGQGFDKSNTAKAFEDPTAKSQESTSNIRLY